MEEERGPTVSAEESAAATASAATTAATETTAHGELYSGIMDRSELFIKDLLYINNSKCVIMTDEDVERFQKTFKCTEKRVVARLGSSNAFDKIAKSFLLACLKDGMDPNVRDDVFVYTLGKLKRFTKWWTKHVEGFLCGTTPMTASDAIELCKKFAANPKHGQLFRFFCTKQYAWYDKDTIKKRWTILCATVTV